MTTVNGGLSLSGRKTAATYLMAIIFFKTNLVKEASDGGSGRASGSSDGDIERLKNLKVDESEGDITPTVTVNSGSSPVENKKKNQDYLSTSSNSVR